MLDCLVIVPFEPVTAPMLDPHVRSTYLARVGGPLEIATVELENYLGVRLNYWEQGSRPVISGREMAFPKVRTPTAVVLASALEHAGLTWHAIDPAVRELGWWRTALRGLRSRAPRTIAVSTTFTIHFPWLNALCRIIRRELPHTRILIGGSYYASNARNFLSLDADVFCVGEGEVRLPEIVKAIREGGSLDPIRGLYIPGAGGQMQFTGHAEFVDLRSHPPVDWSLAARIEPALDLENDLTEVGIETQRGCVFQCEYCSYRTLSAPNALGPEDAADTILRTAIVRNASVNILDATASFPHERWKAVLREIIARGGSPHPLWCFARVSDLNDESVSLMAAAGIRHTFVGQESGDQRILDLMKKGTKIKHVPPAVEALAKHGVSATLGFIHGFPGETQETMNATRRLIETLNQGFEDRPPIITYLLYPFGIPDLAAVSAREEFQNIDHFLDFEARGLDRMAREKTFGHVLETILAVSRIPHAPAYSHLLLKAVMPTSGISLFARHDRPALFRFLKAVERGMAIFLERELEGTPINDRELRSVKETILAGYPAGHRRPAWSKRLLGKPVLDHLRKEWLAEPERGPGLLTRLVTSATMWHQTHDFQLGWRAFTTGNPFARPDAAPEPSKRVDVLAGDLIAHARATPNKYPKEALPVRVRL